MKLPYFLKTEIADAEKENFRTSLISENIHRGRPLAWIVIGFEVIYSLADVVSCLMKVDSRFAFNEYLLMYFLMISLNVAFLGLTRNVRGPDAVPKVQVGRQETILFLYVTLVMCWGGAISLMDQRLYGHLITFMVNVMTCSVIFIMDNRKMLAAYAIAILPLAALLPVFQKSSDVLVGHYMNLIIFIFISWLTSRIMYHSFYGNYMSKILINRSNELLEKEIEENKRINVKLTLANSQLKEMALLDELTGIPNRRSFREFIDNSFPDQKSRPGTLSVIMIDIDFFKQYNDYYGHDEGDKILIAVANQINSVIDGPSEFAVRWGGEEFIYAALDKSPEEITATAEAIRAAVQELNIRHAQSSICPYVTVSMGTCTLPVMKKKDVGEIVRRADRAMYLAKSVGRNCIRDDSEAGAALGLNTRDNLYVYKE